MPRNDPPLYENPEVCEAFDAKSRRFQQQFWESQAHNWQEHQNVSGLQPWHLEGLEDWFANPVLLIGSARGLILKALRGSGWEVIGVDWAQSMVDAATRDGIGDVRQADAADLPFADASFGGVLIASGVLMPTHSLTRTRAYLQEAVRVLRPGVDLALALCHAAGDDDARRMAEAVQLPIHTIHAQAFWDLAPLMAVADGVGLHLADRVDFPGTCILRLTPDTEPRAT